MTTDTARTDASPLEMLEFTSSNFDQNGYSNAHYRRSTESVELESYGDPIRVPLRVEAENEHGEWQQHPAVFVHYGSRENEKNREGSLVIFCADGGIMSSPYRPHVGDPRKALLEEATEKGLTVGKTGNLRSYVREIE
jgi:hypothetical protein